MEKQKTINKEELVERMAEATKITKADIKKCLNGFIEEVEKALEAGEKIQLVGFGTFEARERAARIGRNPRTKEEIQIPESTVPAFKVGKEFKDRVKAAYEK